MDRPTPNSTRCIVVAGGDRAVRPLVHQGDIVIAADSGFDLATAHGIPVDLLVGDLDSTSAEGLAIAEAGDTVIERHPTDKDASDLSLALEAATRHGCTTIDLYGAEGGRLDHLLTVALALTDPQWAASELTWYTTTGIVRPVTNNHACTLPVEPGTIVTLLPVGDATGITTTGMQWDLHDESLHRGSTRGLSNIAQAPSPTVTIRDGAVLVITESGQST